MEIEQSQEILQNNLEKIHTTELGAVRIQRNLGLEGDVIDYIKKKVEDSDSDIKRIGKNWYITTQVEKITINAYNYCVITAHKLSKKKNTL